MNNTNRVLNRAFVLLVGLLGLAVGAVAVALVAVPDFLQAWSRTAPDVTAALSDVLGRTEVADSGTSWVPVAGLALAAALIVLLVVFIARQGHGHTGRLIEAAPTEDGSTIVDAAVAEQLLTDALHNHEEFVTVAVSTYRVHGTPVLKVSATVRRGVAPRAALTIIERAVHGLDRVLGAEIPVLVQLGGGVRTRMSGRARFRSTPTANPQTSPTPTNHPLEKERTR
ncbi:hypothetical protein BJQ94_19085 [Cryobacterium sp. SO2]|uniref:hypothetical protein n=1 Tax=Cryobacterium sp. SO2 TaxID=1897060 RepID=UPI00223D70CB|nr:hypothetical protein [Cryobacterium sp. SO2]WEO77427.1 hypothetical protein BJQ94_19085 [Cryobacterium sp. SO2]